MFDDIEPASVGIHDFRRNGLLLPATEQEAARVAMPLHRGPHPVYSELVIERTGQIENHWQKMRRSNRELASREALMRMDCLQKALRRRLLDPRRWQGPALHNHDPNRADARQQDRALDFSHLDAMAEMLWADSAPVV